MTIRRFSQPWEEVTGIALTFEKAEQGEDRKERCRGGSEQRIDHYTHESRWGMEKQRVKQKRENPNEDEHGGFRPPREEKRKTNFQKGM